MGVSRRLVQVRFLEHLSRIRNKIADVPLIGHFMEGACVPDQLRFFVTSTFKSHNLADVSKTVLHQEACWIHRLSSLSPQGLNQTLDLVLFIR